MRVKEYEQKLIEHVARRLEKVDRQKGYPKKYTIACLIGQEYELLQIITSRLRLDINSKQEKYMYFYRNGKVIHVRNLKKRR